MAEGLPRAERGRGEEVMMEEEGEGTPIQAELEAVGEGSWGTPAGSEKRRLGGDSPPELLLEALGVEHGQIRHWLEAAVEEERHYREWADPAKRNIGQKTVVFTNKKVEKFMFTIKEMAAEYKAMERKVEKVVDRYSRVCEDTEKVGSKVEGCVKRMDQKLEAWVGFSQEMETRMEGMWRDVEKMVRKEVEMSKKEQSRKVDELGQKLDVLCGVINKVHAGVQEVPKVLEREGQREKRKMEEVRVEVQHMGSKVDTMVESVGKISEMEKERIEGKKRIEMFEEIKNGVEIKERGEVMEVDEEEPVSYAWKVKGRKKDKKTVNLFRIVKEEDGKKVSGVDVRKTLIKEVDPVQKGWEIQGFRKGRESVFVEVKKKEQVKIMEADKELKEKGFRVEEVKKKAPWVIIYDVPIEQEGLLGKGLGRCAEWTRINLGRKAKCGLLEGMVLGKIW